MAKFIDLRASPLAWAFDFSTREAHLRSSYSAENPPVPLVLDFNSEINFATLLGLINDDSSVSRVFRRHRFGVYGRGKMEENRGSKTQWRPPKSFINSNGIPESFLATCWIRSAATSSPKILARFWRQFVAAN